MEVSRIAITLSNIIDEYSNIQILELVGNVCSCTRIEIGVITDDISCLFNTRIFLGIDFGGNIFQFGFGPRDEDERHAAFGKGECVRSTDAVGSAGNDGVLAAFGEFHRGTKLVPVECAKNLRWRGSGQIDGHKMQLREMRCISLPLLCGSIEISVGYLPLTPSANFKTTSPPTATKTAGRGSWEKFPRMASTGAMAAAAAMVVG